MIVENSIEKEHALFKAELVREVRALYATLVALTPGATPDEEADFNQLAAERLLELKQKLKRKLDGLLTPGPSADVRFKSGEVPLASRGSTNQTPTKNPKGGL